ncbi:hypothetical protein ACEPAF_4665 [Sanghuangporus sanghuang]
MVEGPAPRPVPRTELETIMSGLSSSTSIGKPRDNHYYFTLTTFEVEDIMFRVPRLPFEAESQIFRDMFALPTDVPADGNSDEMPLVLHGVSAKDFRAFLKVLFDPAHAPQIEPTQDEWTSVMRLAHMWCCDRLFALAISKLDMLIADPVAKIVLAKTFGIKDWLLPAYFELATRKESFTLEEANKLGIECLVRLAEVRESRYRRLLGNQEEILSRSLSYRSYEYEEVEEVNPARMKDVGFLDADVRSAIAQAFNLG